MISKIILVTIVTCAQGYHQHGTSYASVTHYVEPKYHHHETYEYHHEPVVYHLEHNYDNAEHDDKYKHDYHHQEQHYPNHHSKYEFKYGVEDHHTKDIHSQHEHSDGDDVTGEYMLHQPDGRIRIVQYTADKHKGFNAHVSYSGHASHPEQNSLHHY